MLLSLLLALGTAQIPSLILRGFLEKLSRIPQGGWVHMKQLWSQSECRRLQSTCQEECLAEETLLHLFLQGNGEAKPRPAHTVTGAKRGFKRKKKEKKTKKEVITNQ